MNYDSWDEIVKKDLQNEKESFFVLPLVFEMSHNIKQIEQEIENIYKTELIDSTSFLSHLIRDIQTNERGEIKKYSTIEIPLKTMQEFQIHNI